MLRVSVTFKTEVQVYTVCYSLGSDHLQKVTHAPTKGQRLAIAIAPATSINIPSAVPGLNIQLRVITPMIIASIVFLSYLVLDSGVEPLLMA